MIIEDNIKNLCHDMAQKISCFFDVNVEDLYIAKGTESMRNAREFTWYILHYYYFISNNVLSCIYKKDSRTIRRGYAKIKHGVGNQKYYQQLHKDLMEFLEIGKGSN